MEDSQGPWGCCTSPPYLGLAPHPLSRSKSRSLAPSEHISIWGSTDEGTTLDVHAQGQRRLASTPCQCPVTLRRRAVAGPSGIAREKWTARPRDSYRIASAPRVAADERQQFGLRVGVVGHLNPRSVLAAGTQDLVPGLHTGKHHGAPFGVEGLVLTRCAG